MIEFSETLSSDTTLSGEGFSLLFEHSPQAVFLEDAKGIIVDVNQAACRLYDQERTDLCSRHAAEVLPPKLRGDNSRGPKRESLLERNGRSVPVQVLSVTAMVGGDEGLLTMVWTTPQSVGKSNEAKDCELSPSVQDAMELMAGRLAHRFNNLLTTFSGYGSLIEKDLEQGMIRSADIRKIIDAAAEAQEVTGDLLRFSRRQPVAILAPLDLNAFITGYAAEMRERVGDDKEIQLDLRDSPLKIEGNREALDSIFARISKNLADHVPANTVVTIRTGREGENAFIKVRDQGKGIADENIGQVFDPFYTTSGNPGSLGLGLSVVRGLVMGMNGAVSVAAVAEGGTELHITFPVLGGASVVETNTESAQALETGKSDTSEVEFPVLPPLQNTKPESNGAPEIWSAISTEPKEYRESAASEEFANPFQPTSSTMELTTETTPAVQSVPSASPQHKKSTMPKGTETILVVEDEPMVRELVTRSLSYLGYNVIKAENGQNGYEMALAHKEEIDLIFSDIVMPKVSGPEMVHRLADQGENFRVLFTTGFTENKRILVNGEIREGVNLLPKPYTTRELAERIRQALDEAAA